MKQKLMDHFYQECLDPNDSPVGLWINALFSVVTIPELTLEEQKEAFLLLLRRLLDEGRVYLEEPADAAYGSKTVLNADVWAAPHEHMIEHIHRYWPEDIEDENDLRLTDFWYDIHCPRILWFDEENNRLVGS